jgi:hypothetical protein
VFGSDRYFDVYVEYAKASPDDILIRVSVINRGAETAALDVLPTLWFRNTWSWTSDSAKPRLQATAGPAGMRIIEAWHPELGERRLYVDGEVPLLFTENESNNERLFGKPNASPYVKDGINNCLVQGRTDAVNPAQTGTKAASLHRLRIEPGQTATLRLRLAPAEALRDPFSGFEQMIEVRRREADELYAAITPPTVDKDTANVMRQALAGMLWNKQYYFFDVDQWLEEHGVDALQPTAGLYRNREWFHMINDHVISMPTNGSIRGMRPGTLPSMLSHSPVSTRISRKNSSG